MTDGQIQNYITFGALLATIGFAIYTLRQNSKTLNVDINFRALDRRRALFQELQVKLRFFTSELSHDGNWYPTLTESEQYNAALYPNEVEEMAGPYSPELDVLLSQKEKVAPLLVEATLIFPLAKKELKDINDYINDIINLFGDIDKDKKNCFKKTQKTCHEAANKAFGIMKKYLDIGQFAKLKYSTNWWDKLMLK